MSIEALYDEFCLNLASEAMLSMSCVLYPHGLYGKKDDTSECFRSVVICFEDERPWEYERIIQKIPTHLDRQQLTRFFKDKMAHCNIFHEGHILPEIHSRGARLTVE